MSGGDAIVNIGSYSTIATSTSALDVGGLMYLKASGNAIVTIVGPGTSISYSTARKSGGAFYLDAAMLNKLDVGDISISNSVSQDGEGGLAVMNGQDNVFLTSTNTVIDGCTAA